MSIYSVCESCEEHCSYTTIFAATADCCRCYGAFDDELCGPCLERAQADREEAPAKVASS